MDDTVTIQLPRKLMYELMNDAQENQSFTALLEAGAIVISALREMTKNGEAGESADTELKGKR